MKKLFLLVLFFADLLAYGEERMGQDTQIWDYNRITNIANYDIFGKFWTTLQGEYITTVALLSVIAVLAAFALHYVVIGPKQFSHAGKKIYAFSLFERLFHFIVALSWMILVPTGFTTMFGTTFGGGLFVRVCKGLHAIATILFIVSIIPMFFWWIKRMLPVSYGIKWLMIVGDYLNKRKKPVPAGKFNFGQKSWYYIAVFGDFLMIITGSFMYFLDFNSAPVQSIFGLSHIKLLRLSAIIHNLLGIVCAVSLGVHIYMAVSAIKGSIHPIVSGYKEEEEVYILHSYRYKEPSKEKQIEPSLSYEH